MLTAAETFAELLGRHVHELPQPNDPRLLADLPAAVARHHQALRRAYREDPHTRLQALTREEYRRWTGLVAEARKRWPNLWQEQCAKVAFLLLEEGP